MDFVEGGGEEQMGSTSKGKFMIHPNSFHTSSFPSLNSQMGSWLANKDDPEDDLMEVLPPQNQQEFIEKEHMFDKVVTPSDVGKLNRLVIPKKHAEKYFPLDWKRNKKGLLLNFEDWNGKAWRFRYSYWISSQSYVMTRGWSRFVKEKKLDSGDIVSFHRGIGELGKDHLYIQETHLHRHHSSNQITHFRSIPRSPLLILPPSPPPPHRHPYSSSGGYGYNYRYSPEGVYMRSGGGGGQQDHQHIHVVESMVYKSVPVVQGKRLRLFGVNVDCPSTTGDDDTLSSTLISHAAAAPTMVVDSSTSIASQFLHQQELRFYNGMPLGAAAAMTGSSSTGTIEFVNKGSSSSSCSLNLDI